MRRIFILFGIFMGLFAGSDRVLGDGELRFLGSDAKTGASRAVVVDDVPLVHTTQLLPRDATGRLVGRGQPTVQTERVLDNLALILEEAKSSLKQVAKLNVYVARQQDVTAVQSVLGKRFSTQARPAVSYVVTRLPHAEALVALDAVAVSSLDPGRTVRISRSSKGDLTPDATFAIVPPGTRIYVAGQAEKGSDLIEATRKTLDGLRTTLRFLGQRDADIVQIKAFVKPMTGAAVVYKLLADFFGKAPIPPVVLVEWESTLPIEIELIAWGGRDQAGEAIDFVTPPGMTASPIYSRVARINHTRSIYVSGLVADQGPDGAAEVQEIFATLTRILTEAGSDLRHLAKATYYVSTDDASRKLNELRPRYYDPKRPPSASKAAVVGVGQENRGITLDMIAVPAVGPQRPEYGPAEYGHGLTAQEAGEGWLSLFDAQTTFGWTEAKVQGGVLAGGSTTARFGNGTLRLRIVDGGTLTIGGRTLTVTPGLLTQELTEEGALRLGEGVRVREVVFLPKGLASVMPGRNLEGWKRVDRDQIPPDRRPSWTVSEGVLRAVGGPGALEYQGKSYANMVAQVDVRTGVRHANGGLFLRSIPGDFMNGYEFQIYNRGENGDPGRPARWSTGAIDDRQGARRLVSRDGQFFTMTALLQGPHLASWVNGHQLTDWTDTRKPHHNPRQGLRLEAGTIQLQAHDPGTNLEIRNLRVAEWK